MFRNRSSTQKPADEFYHDFRQNFPTVGSSTVTHVEGHPHRSASTSDAVPGSGNAHGRDGFQAHELEHLKDHDPTPRGTHDPWRFTPSLLDPNSFAFASFANQPPGYYTPTPGGTNTLYHSQAGDLHTPGMVVGANMPFSLPTSTAGASGILPLEVNPFSHQTVHSHQAGHDFDSFDPQQSFAPSQFHNHAINYDAMDASANVSPTGHVSMDADMLDDSPVMAFTGLDDSISAPQLKSVEKFRYHVTLNAPTAMIKQATEIPITYLNKGQPYSISIVDTAANQPTYAPVRYRTFIRISFEDEQQRLRPAACWQLWKEGRGTNEAHQRGGKLQAVEFVDPSSSLEDLDPRPKIELESSSFDGFSVIWTALPGSPPTCNVAVRFNFLSTDFSHSKGVKGIPVRLCAKTHVVSTPPPSSVSDAEVCFCKVKLFRDHGAERKLSNDIAHVKKTIEKLKQQISQVDTGMKDFGKKRRSSAIIKATASAKPGKVLKHKRTWSMSSTSSAGGRGSMEDDLHQKLATMQDMFKSPRPASVLYLRGADRDDPDLFPVQMPTDITNNPKLEGIENSSAGQLSASGSYRTGASSAISPSSSTEMLNRRGSQRSPRQPSSEWEGLQSTDHADLQANPQHLASPPDQATKIPRAHSESGGMLTGWIDALGVDSSYQPPPERSDKPVACFYVRLKAQDNLAGSKPSVYRAVYLKQRTVKDLVAGISDKCDIDAANIMQTTHVNSKGLRIMVDDDVVQELPEGQDMTFELVKMSESHPTKREWDSGATDAQIDDDSGIVTDMAVSTFELVLSF